MKPQACIFLLQLGGPKDTQAIQPFLRNLFEDVLPLPGMLRKPLAALIAWRRAPLVTPLYQEIGGGSPLLANTEAQAAALRDRLAHHGLATEVIVVMRYAPPRVPEGLAQARGHGAGVPWVALPLYPQYSYATSRSSLRELEAAMLPAERQGLRVVQSYFDDAAYLEAQARCIDETLQTLTAEQRAQAHLVFSAHGLPEKLVREGDPYPQHIAHTVQGVMARLNCGLPHTLCYQSRVGPVKWLTPSTQDTLTHLGRQGQPCVVVVPIAFVSEHVETLHELDIQLRADAEAAGIRHYVRVPTVGCRPDFMEALAQQVLKALRPN